MVGRVGFLVGGAVTGADTGGIRIMPAEVPATLKEASSSSEFSMNSLLLNTSLFVEAAFRFPLSSDFVFPPAFDCGRVSNTTSLSLSRGDLWRQ